MTRLGYARKRQLQLAEKLINQALAGGASAESILDNGLMPGMDVVG